MFVFKICSERVFTKVQIILPKKLETEEKLALMQADAEFEVGSDGDAELTAAFPCKIKGRPAPAKVPKLFLASSCIFNCAYCSCRCGREDVFGITRIAVLVLQMYLRQIVGCIYHGLLRRQRLSCTTQQQEENAGHPGAAQSMKGLYSIFVHFPLSVLKMTRQR